MPTWLRNFTYQKMKEYYNKQSEQEENLATQAKKIKDGKIDLPSHFKGKLGNKAPKY